MRKLYDESRPWYRGNLHCHTTLSDGYKTPEEAIALYRNEGYSFLAVTDHCRYYESWEEEGFTLLGGTELDDNDMETRSAWHIIGLGMERTAVHTRGNKAPAMVEAVREAGGLAVLGHPHWSLLTHQDMMGLNGVFATEIYSGVSESHTGRGDSSQYADTCMAKGCLRMLLGVDDTHFYTRDLFHAWIMLQAPTLSRQDILNALERGDFYATEGGPAFNQITLDGNRILVNCGEATCITFYSDLFWCDDRVHRAEKTPLTHAEYEIKSLDNYVRVQLTGADGRRSTSQYIRVNG